MPSADYRKKPITIKGACIAALLLTSASIAKADTSSVTAEVQVAGNAGGSATETAPAADSAKQETPIAISDLIVLFQRQADELVAQRELLEAQARQIAALSEEVQTLRSAPAMVTRDEAKTTIAAHQRQLESQRQQIATLVNELDLLQESPPIEEDSTVRVAASTEAEKPVDPGLDGTTATETQKELKDRKRAEKTPTVVRGRGCKDAHPHCWGHCASFCIFSPSFCSVYVVYQHILSKKESVKYAQRCIMPPTPDIPCRPLGTAPSLWPMCTKKMCP